MEKSSGASSPRFTNKVMIKLEVGSTANVLLLSATASKREKMIF